MDLNQESFDRLLTWLHPDPEEAGKRYIQIRSDLVKKFSSHHCPQPEKLADITIDRVARLLPEVIDTYVGEPARYFQRVAYFVLLESRHINREEQNDEIIPIIDSGQKDNVEDVFACLEKCIAALPQKEGDLIKSYYYGEKGAKIRKRQELAVRLNVKLPVLRVLAMRIRHGLKQCITDCLAAPSR